MTGPSPLRAAARSAVRRTFYALIAWGGLVYRFIHRQRPWPERIRSILIVRVDLLGDVLFTMPAVLALRERYPDARIVMLTLGYTAPLARLYPAVDEVVAVDTNRIRTLRGLVDPATWLGYGEVLNRLRSEQFDLAISMSGQMGSLCAFLSGARRVIGYAEEAYRFLLTDPVPGGRYGERRHEVTYDLALARKAGAVHETGGLELPLTPQVQRDAEELLREHGIGSSDRVVVIHGGSNNGAAKRWPAEYWARFAEEVQEATGSAIVLVGASSDATVAEEIRALSEAHIVSLVGKTDVPGLAGVIQRADVVASGDSGPLHFAVALGRPLVSLYGPTDPQVYGPFRPRAPVLLHRRDLPCSPCYTGHNDISVCPLGHHLCMRLITVEEVTRSAVQLLREAP